MSRLTLALAAIVLLLGAGLVFTLVRPVGSGLDEMAVRAIVSDALQTSDNDSSIRSIVADVLADRGELPRSRSGLDPEILNPMIENYLLENPSILRRVSDALQAEVRAAETAQSTAALAAMSSQIYEDPDHVVLGNPQGDVTLVELFDYNCVYCRSAMPDIATLLADDTNLKVILKEFPILSQGSVDAARVGVLVARSDLDYWAFHEALFTGRGQVTAETALRAAQDLGLNPINLRLEMETPRVTAVIERNHDLARALRISGTPTYIIGNEIIPGAVGLAQLRARIANMRACGETACDTAGGS